MQLDFIDMLSSSHTVPATRRRLEHFLKELANTQPHWRATLRLKQQFPDFLPDFPLDTVEGARFDKVEQRLLDELQQRQPDRKFTLESPTGKQTWFVFLLAVRVGEAWAEPDPRQREWAFFLLRVQLAWLMSTGMKRENDIPIKAPPLTPLEQAFTHLQHEGRRAKRCGNENCPAPYFFAKRATQKYCSDECAAPAKREAKLRWWHAPEHHAKEKRRKRRRSQKRGRT